MEKIKVLKNAIITTIMCLTVFSFIGCFPTNDATVGKEGQVLKKYLGAKNLKALIDNAIKKPDADPECDAFYDSSDIDFKYPLWIVDTRDPIQYNLGHIPKAKNYTFPGKMQTKLSEIPKDVYLIVHCETGGRAQFAVDYLKSKGYTKWINWGGIISWPYKTVIGSKPE